MTLVKDLVRVFVLMVCIYLLSIQLQITRNHTTTPSNELPHTTPSSHPRVILTSTQPNPYKYAIVTLTSPSNCTATTVLYKSIRLLDPTGKYCFIMLYSEKYTLNDFRNKLECVLIQSVLNGMNAYCIKLIPVPSLDVYKEHVQRNEVIQERLLYSLQKIYAFSMDMWDRILFIDTDVLIVKNLDDYFEFKEDIVGSVDTFDNCNRRDIMNAGIISIKPSFQIYQVLKTVLLQQQSCLSDQELLNCICDTTSSQNTNNKLYRHDISCKILPYYYGTQTSEEQTPVSTCNEFRMQDVRAIHYSGDKKPWDTASIVSYTSNDTLTFNRSITNAINNMIQSWEKDDATARLIEYWHCIHTANEYFIHSCKDMLI